MSANFDSNVSLTLEVGFDSEPFDETQSFTDITSYLRAFTTRRGRANELRRLCCRYNELFCIKRR